MNTRSCFETLLTSAADRGLEKWKNRWEEIGLERHLFG
jgi:hypothetical protein